jgi:hypothetical protein
MITYSLDEIADQYKDYLSTVLIDMITDFSKHQDNTYSVYELSIDVDGQVFWYIGQTRSPATRASKHKSALKQARVSTKVGISRLYTPEILGNAKRITLCFTILFSGLSREEIHQVEKKVASDYTATFGAEAVLVRP